MFRSEDNHALPTGARTAYVVGTHVDLLRSTGTSINIQQRSLDYMYVQMQTDGWRTEH